MLLKEKGLSFERLKSLVQLCERGNLSQATPQDVVRQNLIGRQLRELEAFFQTKLSGKEGKLLVLNESGKELANLAREMLDSIEDFKRSAIGRRRLYRICSGGSLYTQLLAPRAAALRSLKLEIHLRELFHEQMFEALLNGAVDAGVSWGAPPASYRLKTIALGDFRYALFGNRRLLKARRSQNAFFKLPFVIVKHRDLADELRQRVQTDEVVYVDENLPALRLVQSGHFVAVLPRLYQKLLPSKEFAAAEPEFLNRYARKVNFAWNPRISERRNFSETWVEQLARKFVIDER